MLCNYVENGKNRCSQYLGQEGWTIKETLEMQNGKDIELKNIEVDLDNTVTSFEHIKYVGWPDKNVPDNPEDIWPIIE